MGVRSCCAQCVAHSTSTRCSHDVVRQQENPANECQFCDVFMDHTAWSNRPEVVCDDESDDTHSDVCKAGTCTGVAFTCPSPQACQGAVTKCVVASAVRENQHRVLTPPPLLPFQSGKLADGGGPVCLPDEGGNRAMPRHDQRVRTADQL